MENKPIKPPLGLKPRYIHEAGRAVEILDACHRYSESGKAIPIEWTLELRELLREQLTFCALKWAPSDH